MTSVATQGRAALYARVSAGKQIRGFSLATQLDALGHDAAAHRFQVTHTFVEQASAMTLDRPALLALRKLVADGEVDAVLVYASDRLTRRPVHGALLRDELQRAGVELHYVSDDVCMRGDAGEVEAQSRDSANQRWWQSMREAAMRGRRGKVEAGIIPASGLRPYGYDVAGTQRQTRLVIVEEQAAVVRDIFHWFVEDGATCKEIARRLTERGVPTRASRQAIAAGRALPGWSYNSVVKLLREEIYAGTAYAYRYRKVPGSKRSVLRPREEWIAIPVPAIVNRARWQAAQDRLDEDRQRYRRPPKHAYLFAGQACCSCGYHASGRPLGRGDGVKLYYKNGGARGGSQTAARQCHQIHGPPHRVTVADTSIA